ncbi:hypothetical protein [uncultured Acinetobacter sp.]|uniref:hypothetical protein n=1 Tax=uncultured Acinetobacter sp. TaxID=165433 RepID=UPI002584756E|nr:hypothetical protein [uncultured Acinetobacter sp.]
MDLVQIKSKVSEIYDNFVNHENFKNNNFDELRYKEAFLNDVDRLFDTPYESHGFMGSYSYVNDGVKFIEFNLNDAPSISDRSGTIEWFSQLVLKTHENLGK